MTQQPLGQAPDMTDVRVVFAHVEEEEELVHTVNILLPIRQRDIIYRCYRL